MAKSKKAPAEPEVASPGPVGAVPDAPTPPTPEPAAEKPTASKSEQRRKAALQDGQITVKYRDHKGEPTERTFSQEVHGDNFADLAAEFKASNAGKLIKEE